MRTKQALAIAMMCGLALNFNASAKVVYDNEYTNDWFAVSAANPALDTDSHWTKPTKGGTVEAADSKIKLDTDLDDPLVYKPEQVSANLAIVSAHFAATANASAPELQEGDAPQAALTVVANGADTNWYGYVKGSSGNEWVKFDSPIPVVGKEYDIKIEFDLHATEKKIRYSVGGVILGDGWYDNPKTTAASIASVSFAGTGDIGNFDGKNVSEAAASFNGVNYPTFAAALAAAKTAGGTTPVVLYKDADYTASATETIYVDINGHQFTVGGERALEIAGTAYTITIAAECEALIDSTYYSTIEKAIAAATANQTITVNKDLNKNLTFNKTSVTLDTNGKSVTCETLMVADGVTLTLANPLTVTAADIAGSVAGAALTVNGTLTGTAVATLTFGDSATFAYAGAPLAATTLTIGNSLAITGLTAVKLGDVIISNIGEADVSKFEATLPEGLMLGKDGTALKVVAVPPDVVVTLDEETAGYDFTNETLSVTVTDVQPGKGGSVVLKYVDFDTGVEASIAPKTIEGTGTIEWDLSDLIPGGTYTYAVEVKDSTGKLIDTKYGTFTAANWASDVWFGADASSGTGAYVNGSWDDEPTIDSGAFVIDDTATFNVDDATEGTGNMTRVDANVTFDSLVDSTSLEVEAGALGGFVAASANDIGVWMTLTKIDTADPAWVALTGAVAPVANTPYLIRAEVSFLEGEKKVRYLVSTDGGESFTALTYNNSPWIPLANDSATTLAKVELQGSGKLTKLEAKIADKSLAEVGGVKYDDMAAALAKGGTITLLTNVTVKPTAAGTWTFEKGGFNVSVDLSALPGAKCSWSGDTLTVTVAAGATYMVW